MIRHLGKRSTYLKKTIVGQLRRTQMITTFGSGAIVDMPDYSVIMAATDYWSEESPTIQEPSLEKLLKVTGFKEPKVSENTDNGISADIPAYRFPYMHFCPSCHRLMSYWLFDSGEGKKCPKCNRSLVPSRFIAACVNGHLEDFPYNWWVHQGDFSECTAGNTYDNLEIFFSEKTGGLESIVIKCKCCGKTRSMEGSLSQDGLKGYHCRGRRPWIGAMKEDNDPVECKANMRGLQRGASNVYFPQTISALTIPPWSKEIDIEIGKNWNGIRSALDEDISEEDLRTQIKIFYNRFLEQKGYSIDDFIAAIYNRYNRFQQDDNYSRKQLYEDEYEVFCRGNYNAPDDKQFRIERTEVPEYLTDHLADVVMVKRLREVMALRGFRRITPDAPKSGDDRFQGYNQNNEIVLLSKDKQDWLPAIELLGEGIFIRFNEEKLTEWEENSNEYYSKMRENLMNSYVSCPNFSPRYVLLHTFSHLLIRQLSIECGYSSTSLKERIYSTYPDSKVKMSGVLIYTSSSDSDGSLGGLVRNAVPEALGDIIEKMLIDASWCSSDPVCIESHSQGLDSLNYAACHACTLISETSCEMRNCLLDRGAVVGSLEDRNKGYFGDLF